MLVTSKIKSIFPPEVLRYIAAICDNKRIESNNKKMIILGDLLYSNGIKFEILGGATNRIALQIEGYAIKFALDDQGYQDNLIEYSLSPELQPYVTKSYETNGYIQIQECVEVLTPELFQTYKNEIYKILDLLAQDYLLGDVGYITKNRANWGARAGKPVILDYAYCHRATENLFTCSKCGAPLRYDSTYDKLMCSDRSACKTIYTYNERKRIQGQEVDINMIKERKSQSIKLSKGEVSRDIETFGDKLVGDNYFVIDSPEDYYNYRKLKEEQLMRIMINGGDDIMTNYEDIFAAMIDLAKNPKDADAKTVVLSGTTEPDEVEDRGIKPIFTEYYEENFVDRGLGFRQYPSSTEVDEGESTNVDDEELSLEDLIDMANQKNDEIEEMNQKIFEEQTKAYLDSINGNLEGDTLNVIITEGEEPITIGEAVTKAVKEVAEEVIDNSNKLSEDVKEPSIEDITEGKINNVPNVNDATILVNGNPIEIGQEVTV